ncbi:serine/threonine-protein phosphatase 2A regulatory subunit B'' subunit beta-like [Dendronephthya gigantea]|uniref:serine/threonine-protein phosphatase 2A regulatory subunit B'' subunit beta-like n=1 Tax=Dendronephthya gigantea TaxID=151771 RepID=UPI00106CB99F|nr:serine/threonine-protein phosphatase 2A regulatory subunit B'' subunit beta-like [Dendronephthya gigantea]
MRINMASTLVPLLKSKVDELFLKWLSTDETQRCLQEDLSRILHGVSPAVFETPVISTVVSARPASPPAPPSATLTARSPRSPKPVRKLNKCHNKPNDSPLASLDVNDGSTAAIPHFYFPKGTPSLSAKQMDEKAAQLVENIFKINQRIPMKEFSSVTKACKFPLYWRSILFNCCGGQKTGYVTHQNFSAVWKRLTQSCHDEASRFMYLMTCNRRDYLISEDFIPLVQDVVDNHGGLAFLADAPEFHSRYIKTVIARIFFSVNSSWSGKITLSELRNSNFLKILSYLEDEEDINLIVDYFSYEHFYVIYCKFWELDSDHDLLIDEKELLKHGNHAISSKVVNRIFSGCVTKCPSNNGKMTYEEFVWFLMAEEDKHQPRSIEYWFRCMDLDGDGIISLYELEYFYEDQVAKMEALGIEAMSFEDCICSVLDLVKPKEEGKVSLGDLKRCGLAHIFFNTFLNLDKYVEYEQRDPFASLKSDPEERVPSDWEKFCLEEYGLLIAEEGASDDGKYDDLLDLDDDDVHASSTDDIYEGLRNWQYR